MFLYLAAKVYTSLFFFDGIRFQEKSIVWNTRKTDSNSGLRNKYFPNEI
jgi:hypothetical protein